MRRRFSLLVALAVSGGAAAPLAPAAGAADPAACQPACPPPLLVQAEPALHRSVHLGWTDPHGELVRETEIARRAAGASGPWSVVARLPAAASPHVDDRGASGDGLAPGDYEYRLRARHRLAAGEVWSGWSAPRPVALRSACAEVGELTGLARVVASDRDGDGRHTGADLERALAECSERGGCILEVLPVSYEDVAIVFSDGDRQACIPERTACVTARFPKGLAIEGHGSATVLRSPLWSPPYQPVALLELWKRPDLRIQIRHLVLDGRKGEQRAPHPGTNDSVNWWHYGFQTWNQWGDHDLRNRGGCIHDVVVREFMNHGLVLADVAGWTLERNTVEGIGCDAELTPCPRLGVGDFGAGPFQSGGTGIMVGWYSDDVSIRENRIRRVTKYALGLKHGADGMLASIRRPRIVGNRIEDTGSLGIFLAGVAEGRFEANRIASTRDLDRRPETRPNNDTFGISSMGAVERTGFLDTRLEQLAGMAVSWQSFGVGNYLAGTRISGSCREKGPGSCTPGSPVRCYTMPDLYVGPAAAGTLALVDGVVRDSGCAAPLGVELTKPGLELLIRGGSYAAGPQATRPVYFHAVDVLVEGGTTFLGTTLEFGRAARGVIAPSVSVAGTREPFRADRSARLLACPAEPSACEELCASPEPPRWCAAPTPTPGARSSSKRHARP